MPPSGSANEDFMLIVSGQTQYAPYLRGWKEFKDHIRPVVKGQPRWTEVVAGRHRGEMQVWCRLDTKQDAEFAYDNYVKSRGILVHLFKTSRSSGDYRMLKCNCWSHFRDISERSHSPNRSGITVVGVNQHLGRSGGVSPQQYTMPAPPVYPYAGYPQAPTYNMAPMTQPIYASPIQPVASQIPMYSASTSGIPVNVCHGAMLTEARGIFISNLNYNVGPSELTQLLSTVGRPVECKLHRDSRTGAFRGAATAKFATKEEAQYAIQNLNHTEHMGMTINVRFDTDTTVIGQVQPPIIVNGSNVSRA